MHLQNILQKLHHRSYAYMTGSGTAGLYCILKAAGLSNAKVAVPNNVCMNVPLAVKYSGNIPVYFDISPDNLGLSADTLKSYPSGLDAVVAVHAYGLVCSINEISDYCQRKNILLIEDVAVAQGAKVNGKPAGTFGDVSLLSFGRGKIIDVGHGGSVLTDNKGLLKEIEKVNGHLAQHSKTHDEKVSSLNNYFTQLYNLYYGKGLKNYTGCFVEDAMQAKEAFLYKYNPAYSGKIEHSLSEIDNNIADRRKKSQFLTEKFSGIPIKMFSPPEGSVPWRYNIFLEKNDRDFILHTLLKKGYKISSWFPSIALFLNERNETLVKTPISDKIGDTILNIWVNHEINEDYLKNISDEIIQLLNDMKKYDHRCNNN